MLTFTIMGDHNSAYLSFLFFFFGILEYEVREMPNLHTWMEGGLDYIMLQYLNIDGIRTIGSVLGQSIALDYYVRQVPLSNGKNGPLLLGKNTF